MIRILLLSVLSVGVVHSAPGVDPAPKFMYDIQMPTEPAFCSLFRNNGGNNGLGSVDLACSSFTGDMSRKDQVYQIKDVDKFLTDSNFEIKTLTEELVWPNEVSQVPDGIFSGRTWAVASAFFLGGKDNGSISLIDMSPGASTDPVHISPFDDDNVWFYHRVLWEDMNNDGHMDAITARGYGTGAGAEEAQLIWLENPGSKSLSSSWKMHIIHEGKIEIAFQLHRMQLPDGSTTPVIINSGFWSKELSVVWSSTNDWSDKASIQYLVVDNFGWYFDLQIVDLNMDGSLDILATTWSQLGDPGALLAYEIPANWQTEQWTRHILQDGYRSWFFPGFGSPGTATAFWPIKGLEEQGIKPFIMITGDDDGKAWVVSADSQDRKDWNYSAKLIYEQPEGTVGLIAVGDVNGDGVTDVFLPSYEYKFIRVMSYLKKNR